MYDAIGSVTIAPTVLVSIVRLTALEEKGVSRIATATPNVRGLLAGHAVDEGICVDVADGAVEISVHVHAEADTNLLKLGEALQQSITRAIEEMVGMPVVAVDVYIDGVEMPAE